MAWVGFIVEVVIRVEAGIGVGVGIEVESGVEDGVKLGVDGVKNSIFKVGLTFTVVVAAYLKSVSRVDSGVGVSCVEKMFWLAGDETSSLHVVTGSC